MCTLYCTTPETYLGCYFTVCILQGNMDAVGDQSLYNNNDAKYEETDSSTNSTLSLGVI